MQDEKLPSPADFILRHPLYLETHWDNRQVFEIADLKYFRGAIDNYCIDCKHTATFHGRSPARPKVFDLDWIKRLAPGSGNPIPEMEEGPFHIELVCTRNEKHVQHYVFLVRRIHFVADGKLQAKNTVQKIGQYPSVGDLHIPHLAKYKTILGEEKHRELVRGVGLASHDVGIGAFVYVRRIFESLLEEAHESARSDPGWNEEKFQQQRVLDRIRMLSGHLPSVLVEHSQIYSILSKGVHELSEEECLKYFDSLRMGIELILDEKLESHARKGKTEKLKQFISNVTADLTKKT